MSTTQEFGKLRSFLWPIHNFELKKLIPMLLIFFLVIFNYTVMRDAKDAILVTAPGSGAEVIPFIKLWGVLPMAVIFMVLYAKMSNKLSKPALFYATLAPFIVFFGLFATVLYPLQDVLHPHAFCDKLQTILPQGLNGIVAMLRNWTFSLFYIMAELWGSVALSLLFWGFANDITRVGEAKRFYALFGLGGNLAMPCAGAFICFISNMSNNVAPGVDPWAVPLNYFMGLVVLCGLAVMAIYWWMQKNVLTDKRFYDAGEVKTKKEKPKLSMKESAMYLLKSKYMGCLALLVICYGISINLVEVTWKSQLKLQYPTAVEYMNFMGKFSFTTGIVTIFMMLFVGGNIVRRLGWTAGALATPIMLSLTGIGFFAFVIFRDQLGGMVMALGTTPLMLACIFGAAQNVLSKSSKYSLFDPTKEMAYIPLDQEQKVKGKAAIDVVGARLGKSGGALIQQMLIIACGSVAAITPYVALLLLGFIGIWLISAKTLGKQFNALQAKKTATATTEKLAKAKADKPETAAAAK